MTQNIIDVSWDIAKFDAQTQQVLANMTKVYDLGKEISGQAIKPGSMGGFAELKQAVEQTNNLSVAQERLIATQKNATLSAAQLASAVGQQTASLEANIKARIGMQNSMESYIASQKEDLVLLKQGVITRDEYNRRYIEGAVKIEQYKNKIAVLNKEIKTQTQTTAQQAGAYAILNKEYLLAQTNAKNLAVLYGVNSAEAKTAAASALALNKELQTIDKTVGQHQRNVGNYSSAFGDGFTKAGMAATRFYGILRKVAYILPGIGISGIVGFLVQPIIDMTTKLLGLGEASEEVKKQQQDMEDAFKSAADSAATEISKVTVLKTVLDSENTTRAQKITALKDLKKINSDYFGQLDIENGKVNGLENSYDAYIQKLLRSINIKANEEQLTAALKEQNEVIGKINQSRENGFKHTLQNLTEYERRTAIAEFNLNFGQGKNKNKVITPEQDQLIVDLLNKRDLVKQIMNQIKDNIQDDFNPKPEKEHSTKQGSVTMDSTKEALDLEFELYKINQQRKIKLIAEEMADEKKSVMERVLLAEDYMNAVNELSDKTYQHEIANEQKKLDALKVNYAKSKGTEKNNLAVEIENTTKQIKILQAKQNDARLSTQDEFDKNYNQMVKDQAAKDLAAFKAAEEAINNVRKENQGAIDAQRVSEKASHDELLKNKTISQKQYDKAEKKSINDSLLLSLNADLKKEESLRALAVLQHQSTVNIDNEIIATKAKIKSANADNDKGDKSKVPPLEDSLKSIADSGKDIATSLVDAKYQKEMEAIQKIIDLNNYRKEQEIANINASTLSNQEKAAQMILLDKTVAANNKKLEREKVAMQIKQAKFDRDAAILSITENAAISIFKLTAQAGFAGIAAGVAIGAAAAAQIAMLLAKPLPQMPAYAKGTDNHPGGPAIVGEGKFKELVSTPDGKSFIADKPTFIPNLLAGSKVIPLTKDIVNEGMYHSMIIGTAQRIQSTESAYNSKSSNKDVIEAIELGSMRTVQAMKKQRGANVIVNVDSKFYAHIMKVVKE